MINILGTEAYRYKIVDELMRSKQTLTVYSAFATLGGLNG